MPEVVWPDGFERTAPGEREPYPHGFQVGRVRAFENILEQLELLGAEKVMIDSGAVHQSENPNLPYEDTTPDDPSVVVYFMKDGDDYAVPCDRWDNLRDNAQSIAKYLDAKRALDRYGVKTIRSELTTQQLPGPNDAGTDAIGDEAPHKVLGVDPDASDEQIKAAARALKKQHHPDKGGDYDDFKRVVQAEDIMLDR